MGPVAFLDGQLIAILAALEYTDGRHSCANPHMPCNMNQHVYAFRSQSTTYNAVSLVGMLGEVAHSLQTTLSLEKRCMTTICCIRHSV